ncbi:hypothetical protein DFH29DRAFT_400783 [Suillus ampliporus]|nr:hypothetical protein DFH29DRAFT_400783 [Suillus ampliporus]
MQDGTSQANLGDSQTQTTIKGEPFEPFFLEAVHLVEQLSAGVAYWWIRAAEMLGSELTQSCSTRNISSECCLNQPARSVNFGLKCPAAYGVLGTILELNGEEVLRADPVCSLVREPKWIADFDSSMSASSTVELKS